MANSKRKCTGCKEYYPQSDCIKLPAGYFHSFDCSIDYANSKVKKSTIKANKKAVADLNRKDLRWQHKQTQKAFNKLRVLQELKWFYDLGIKPQCISCGKEDMDWCCGHLKTVGSAGRLRYDEKNTYLQCNRYCNMGLSGNINGNTKTRGYLNGLHERFGYEAAYILEYCTQNTHAKKWECNELESMRKSFNKSIRHITKP